MTSEQQKNIGVGDTVAWPSHISGRTTTKIGVVVAVVPTCPEGTPRKHLADFIPEGLRGKVAVVFNGYQPSRSGCYLVTAKSICGKGKPRLHAKTF